MKPTENYEQLLERFTKRIKQVGSQTSANTVEAEKIKEQLDYLRGCKDTIEYLMTGKLPNDGNHNGMKDHKPRKHNDLGSLD
jgi:hypothetical protein|tara:strand:+ start:1220 stop:1465 length:246 start_codon:yes stop_codon:yes gene_type:complete